MNKKYIQAAPKECRSPSHRLENESSLTWTAGTHALALRWTNVSRFLHADKNKINLITVIPMNVHMIYSSGTKSYTSYRNEAPAISKSLLSTIHNTNNNNSNEKYDVEKAIQPNFHQHRSHRTNVMLLDCMRFQYLFNGLVDSPFDLVTFENVYVWQYSPRSNSSNSLQINIRVGTCAGHTFHIGARNEAGNE